MLVFIVLLSFYKLRTLIVQAECISPPLECPNVNVTFFLYTRSNENKPHQLLVNDEASLKDAPWVKDAPIKILIHGYTGDKDFSPNLEIRPVYLRLFDYNIISVDYGPIALEPCYLEAARNTELVGKCTAQLIDTLVYEHNFDLENFHVIGFSLGGQTAGFIGNYLTCGQIPRISGLDPALPCFATVNDDKKLDKSDARFIDVIHTNVLIKGKLEKSGHVDFYANGGMTQPGCRTTAEQTQSGCDHARAPIYYSESIETEVGFWATKCYSWITYMIGWCEIFNSDDEILMGEYCPHNASGTYFLSTNDKPPFAKGHSKKNRRR